MDKSVLIKKVKLEEFYKGLDNVGNSQNFDSEPLIIKSEVIEDYDNDEIIKDIYIHLSAKQIRSGILRQLTDQSSRNNGINTARNFLVLMTLASFMNYDMQAFPSQKKIAELTGLNVKSVRTAIRELEQMEIGGKPVLTVKQIPIRKSVTRSIYSFDTAQQLYNNDADD